MGLSVTTAALLSVPSVGWPGQVRGRREMWGQSAADREVVQSNDAVAGGLNASCRGRYSRASGEPTRRHEAVSNRSTMLERQPPVRASVGPSWHSSGMGAEVDAVDEKYGPVHDGWILRCGAALLGGLAHRQDQGGYKVTDVHLAAGTRSFEVKVTFDGCGPARLVDIDVVFLLDVDNLRRLFPDPQEAVGAYIYDLHLMPSTATPGVTTVVRVV